MQKYFYQYLPVWIFSGIWCIVFWIYSRKEFNIHSTSPEAFFLLLTGIIGFILSYVVFVAYDNRYNFYEKNRHEVILNKRLLINTTLAYSGITVIGAIIVATAVAQELGGYDVYLTQPLSVRQQIVSWQLGRTLPPLTLKIGSYISNIGFLCSILGGILFSQKGRARFIGLIPLLCLLISQLTSFGRYAFVNGLIFFLFSYVLFNFFYSDQLRRSNLKRIAFFVLVSILFLGFMFYFIVKFRSPLAEDIFKLLNKSVYFYLTGGVPSLDHFLNSFNNEFTYGQSSFRSLFRWLNYITGDQETTINVHNSFVSISPTQDSNTYTFVKSIYQDFNIYGLVLLVGLWAYLTKKVIYSFYSKFSVLTLMVVCIFLYSLFISFFSFYFQSISQLIFWFLNTLMFQYLFGEKLIKNHDNSSSFSKY